MCYEEFLIWARKRENLPEQNDFYVYYEAYHNKAFILLDELQPLLGNNFAYIYYHAALHYCIVTNYTKEEGGGFITNPLYSKYKVSDKGFITSSVSADSSSASIHTTKSLNEGDFQMTDLLRSPYGEYVYSILEQLGAYPVLL